jgi:serine phosphatase RsbU (regulator of sigma subunit)/pSer/pThr/pTyr-binding forkhead associated (FHA) protein
MASLLILNGAEHGQRLALEGEKTVIGRDPTCQVVIPGTAVSRTHAQIVCVDGKYYIEDLKSRNHTYVNDEDVTQRRRLRDNDRIKICDFVCVFRDGSGRLPAQPRTPMAEPDLELERSEDTSSSVEAAISNVSSHAIFETQPAEKLKAILEISANLSKTLELDPLLPKIVDSLFQLFKQADRGFIILRDAATQKLIPKVIRTRRSQDEDNARFSRKIVNQCIENVQAFLSDDAATDSRFGASQSIADFHIRSVMCVPLWTQDGKAFGVIQLDTQDRTKKFTQDDLNLLVGVASQASIALENAKLHQDLVARERLKRDLELAREVQRSFLPTSLPRLPGYEFFANYESALEVSGDYYDFIPLPRGRLAITLGDVAGKGVAAALLMAKFSAEARFCMLTEPEPAAAITRLNGLMSGMTDRFVTLAAVVLDPAANELTMVNAGHPSPLIHRRRSLKLEEAVPREAAGLPIGVLDGFEYASCRVRLEEGDCVLVFSDGVTDAMDVGGNALQNQGIFRALEGETLSPAGVGQRLMRVVKQHASGRSQHDDITLVSFGRTGQAGASKSNGTSR